MDVPGKSIDRAGQHRAFDKLILDLNSSETETCGWQERVALPRDGASLGVTCWALFLHVSLELNAKYLQLRRVRDNNQSRGRAKE